MLRVNINKKIQYLIMMNDMRSNDVSTIVRMRTYKIVVLFRRLFPPIFFSLTSNDHRDRYCLPRCSFPKFLYDITVLISLARLLIAFSSLIPYTKPSIPCHAFSNLILNRLQKQHTTRPRQPSSMLLIATCLIVPNRSHVNFPLEATIRSLY